MNPNSPKKVQRREEEKLLKLIKEDVKSLSYEEIINKYGHVEVIRLAGKFKYRIKRECNKIRDEKIKKELLTSNLSQNEIAKKFHLTKCTFVKYKLKMPVRLRLEGKALKTRNNKLKADRLKGMSISELNKKYNLSNSAMYLK